MRLTELKKASNCRLKKLRIIFTYNFVTFVFRLGHTFKLVYHKSHLTDVHETLCVALSVGQAVKGLEADGLKTLVSRAIKVPIDF